MFKPSELATFTDAQLRALYALIRAYVCNTADELADFNEDIAWHLEHRPGGLPGYSKSVYAVWLAYCDLESAFTRRQNYEPAPGVGPLEWPQSTFHLDQDGLDALISQFKAAIS